MLALPTLFNGTGNYSITVQLDANTYTLEFNWNDRQSAWFFNLLDVDGNPVLMGRKVVLNLPMLHEFVGSQFPTGDFLAFDSSPSGNVVPGLNDLGARVIMYYLTSDDLAEFKAILDA